MFKLDTASGRTWKFYSVSVRIATNNTVTEEGWQEITNSSTGIK